MAERRITDRRDIEDDRRKIPRFTNAELNKNLEQTKVWIRVLYASSIIAAVTELAYSLSKGLENITQGFFFGTIFIILAILLWKCNYTIDLFIENHSINNLKRVHEQLQALFAYMSVLGVIFYIISFLYRV